MQSLEDVVFAFSVDANMCSSVINITVAKSTVQIFRLLLVMLVKAEHDTPYNAK